MSKNEWNGWMYFLIYLIYCSNIGQRRFNGFSGEWLTYGEDDYNRAEREMRKGSERFQGWMKDYGDALEQSSIKESKRGKSQEGSMEVDGGQLFAHWSTTSPVRGTDDPKPESLPAVVHLPRPPWHWPNLYWLIFFQALKCDLSTTFLYHTATNLDLELSFWGGINVFNRLVMPSIYLHTWILFRSRKGTNKSVLLFIISFSWCFCLTVRNQFNNKRVEIQRKEIKQCLENVI